MPLPLYLANDGLNCGSTYAIPTLRSFLNSTWHLNPHYFILACGDLWVASPAAIFADSTTTLKTSWIFSAVISTLSICQSIAW